MTTTLLVLFLAAPLPFVKPAASAAGDYTMSWNGSEWDVTLHSSGAYEAVGRYSGTRWRGAWTAEGRDVTVIERLDVNWPLTSGGGVKWTARILTPKSGVDLPSIWMMRRKP